VTQIDETVVANGRPGSVSSKLRQRYIAYMTRAEFGGRDPEIPGPNH
jgi:hypothetical protein